MGQTVYLQENKVNIPYLVVHQGNPDTSLYDSTCWGTWLLRKTNVTNKSWGDNNYDYVQSDVYTYLNGDFIQLFSSAMQEELKMTNYPTHRWSGTVSGSLNVESFTSKVFVLSAHEVGLSGGMTAESDVTIPEEGTKLDYFLSGTSTEANEQRKYYSNGSGVKWWVRTPYNRGGASNLNPGVIEYTGDRLAWASNPVYCAVRPAFILDSNLMVDDSNVLILNANPLTPTSLNVPDGIYSEKSISISWSESSDVDDNLEGYILERALNSSSDWSQIYKGSALTYTDTVVYGTNYLQYRLKAYDSEGAESEYITSSKKAVLNNSAPTMPSVLTLPSSLKSEEEFQISWSASSDVDNNLQGYLLERSLNQSENWVEIYKGSSLNTKDTLVYGTNYAQYRVKAYDAEGAESAYYTSVLMPVINNTPPVISGTDSDLGTFSDVFTQKYTVTDSASDVVTVSEYVDSVEVKKFTVTLGAENTFVFPTDTWLKLNHGTHKITIKATDSSGEIATRNFTFTKVMTEIELMYQPAYALETMPTVGILTVKKVLAEGASYSVEVCNNGFDDNPTWETVTAAVNQGGRFYFSNTVKTASTWGFNARIKVDRNGAVGECSISHVSGYFR